MTIEFKLTLIGAGSILLLEAIGSLLSVHFQFTNVIFCPATLAVYFFAPYWAAKHLPLRATLAFGAFLGLVDSTLGRQLCIWLGADPEGHLQKITFMVWCISVILLMIFGALVALFAYFIASQRKNRKMD